MKKREEITRLKVNGIVYKDAQDMAEVRKKNYNSVFIMEVEFVAEREDLGRSTSNTATVT